MFDSDEFCEFKSITNGHFNICYHYIRFFICNDFNSLSTVFCITRNRLQLSTRLQSYRNLFWERKRLEVAEAGRVFTNVPWKYLEAPGWRHERSP